MNFGWVYPEDSGEYVCRAKNAFGVDETRGVIRTSGKPGIIYESQLPKGMASIDQIRKMESGWQRAPDMVEQEAEKFKPCFVTKPEPQEVCEGDSSRFCCRVTGYPKPRVMWLLNGHTVINVSRNLIRYNFHCLKHIVTYCIHYRAANTNWFMMACGTLIFQRPETWMVAKLRLSLGTLAEKPMLQPLLL